MLRLARFVGLVVIAGGLALSLAPTVHAQKASAIAYGDTVEGALTNKKYYDLYQFDGTRGDQVIITMIGDGALDPYLGLLRVETEEVLAEDDDSAGDTNALIDFSLPADGTYIIVATRYDLDTGTTEGAYTLELQGGQGSVSNISNVLNQQDTVVDEPGGLDAGTTMMGPIAIGDVMMGEITDGSYAHLYEIEMEANTAVFAAMFANRSELDSYLIILNEGAEVIAEDDNSAASFEGASPYDAGVEIVASEAGLYYIAATRSGGAQGQTVGDYALTVLATEDPIAQQEPPEGIAYGGAMAVGDTVNGTISREFFVQVWDFQGQAGQQVTMTAASTSDLDPYLIFMHARSGEILAEDDDSGGGAQGLDAQISIRLPESAYYMIGVSRNGLAAGTTVGDYTLTLSEGAPAAPDGTETSGGFGGLPSRAIESDQGVFYLRGFGNSDDPTKASPLEAYFNPS